MTAVFIVLFAGAVLAGQVALSQRDDARAERDELLGILRDRDAEAYAEALHTVTAGSGTPAGHGYTPAGYAPCTREPGHAGPCAHSPVATIEPHDPPVYGPLG